MYLTALLVLVPGGLIFALFYRGKRWIELVVDGGGLCRRFYRLQLQWSVQRRIEAVDAVVALPDPRGSYCRVRHGSYLHALVSGHQPIAQPRSPIDIAARFPGRSRPLGDRES